MRQGAGAVFQIQETELLPFPRGGLLLQCIAKGAAKSGGYVSPTFTEWMMDGI